MTQNEVALQDDKKPFKVISYEEEVEFKYTLPDEDEPRVITHELTLVWEDTIEKFIEQFGEEKEYRVQAFSQEKQQQFVLHQIESRTEDAIEEVEEEIAAKMKFGFEFTGQLHNDD